MIEDFKGTVSRYLLAMSKAKNDGVTTFGKAAMKELALELNPGVYTTPPEEVITESTHFDTLAMLMPFLSLREGAEGVKVNLFVPACTINQEVRAAIRRDIIRNIKTFYPSVAPSIAKEFRPYANRLINTLERQNAFYSVNAKVARAEHCVHIDALCDVLDFYMCHAVDKNDPFFRDEPLQVIRQLEQTRSQARVLRTSITKRTA